MEEDKQNVTDKERGITYKDLYKSEEKVDDIEMRKMWGEKVKGRACYRYKLLQEKRKKEFMDLYKKIFNRDKVLGGQVPGALAMAFVLHCNGQTVDWLSFYEHASSASRTKRMSHSAEDVVTIDEEEENDVPKVISSPRAPSSYVTSNTKQRATSSNNPQAMSTGLEKWISGIEDKISRLALESQSMNDRCNDLTDKIKGLGSKQAHLEGDIGRYEALIATLPTIARVGIEAVIDLQKKELAEITPVIKDASNDLLLSEISRDGTLDELKKMKSCLKRMLLARQTMSQSFDLDPPLPQGAIVMSNTKDSIQLNEACPFCHRSLKTDGMLLPTIVAECMHAYHLPCCLVHFSVSEECCESHCEHKISMTWISLLGLNGRKRVQMNTMIESCDERNGGFALAAFTPTSMSSAKENKLLPRRLSAALTVEEEHKKTALVITENNVKEGYEIVTAGLDPHVAVKEVLADIKSEACFEVENDIYLEETEDLATMSLPPDKEHVPERPYHGQELSDTASSPSMKSKVDHSPCKEKRGTNQALSSQFEKKNVEYPVKKNCTLKEQSIGSPKQISQSLRSEESYSPGSTREQVATIKNSKRGGDIHSSPSMLRINKRLKLPMKLLIFELEGVLCKLFEKGELLPSSLQDGAEAKHLNLTKILVLRPRALEFLEWCVEHFRVAIWTTLTSVAANLILKHTFPKSLRDKLLFTWCSDVCTNTSFKVSKKPILLKDLNKVYHDSRYKGTWAEHNTVLIDDMLYRGYKNSAGTVVTPNSYQPSRREGNFLFEHLKPFLAGLLEVENLKDYVLEKKLSNLLDKESKQAMDILKKFKYS